MINALAGTSLLDGRSQDTVDWTSDFQIFDFVPSIYPNGTYTQSFWIKVLSGTMSNMRIAAETSVAAIFNDVSSSPSDWEYFTATANYTAANGAQVYRDLVQTETFTTIIDAHQCESGKFASSYIDVNGASASRVADSLTFPAGVWPTRLASGKWRFNWFPCFAQDEVDSDVVLWSAGGSADELRYNATSDAIEFLSSSVQRGIGSALTFSGHQKITVTVDMLAREITVAGATTGNSTFALSGTDEWPTNVTLRAMGRQGGALECFGRITEPEAA